MPGTVSDIDNSEIYNILKIFDGETHGMFITTCFSLQKSAFKRKWD